jgi:hypothetical protein
MKRSALPLALLCGVSAAALADPTGLQSVPQSTPSTTLSGSVPSGNLGNALGTLVSSQTVAAGAAIQFTGLSGNAAYKMLCHGINPATTNVHLQLQVGEGGTPTWETGGSYWVAGLANNSSGAASAVFAGETATGILLDWSATNTLSGATQLAQFEITFADLANIAGYKGFDFVGHYLNTSSHSNSTFGYGAWHGDTGAITALQLMASSGNISGTCNLYQLSGS